ncbi:hypothetical protein FACS1894187_18450 [Synergistales bacterium]|nr:hypothetical protein FACS1894187_18450 [Synergistales bacterium]
MNDMAERVGLYTVGRISASLPQLLFREQFSGDTGLGAHLEVTEDFPRPGKTIGLQVRSDGSTKLERSARGYIYRGEMPHLVYWLQHSVPVLVMIHERESDRILWEFVNTANVEIEGAEWELVIPFDQVYGQDSASAIAALPCYSPHLARLALDKPWMELIAGGKTLSLEMDEWINRPSARGVLRLCLSGEGGARDAICDWAFQTNSDMPYSFRLPSLFPWAVLSIDEEFYRSKDAYIDGVAGNVIRPWTVEAGEIARFVLKFSLNELGNSFLTAERFLRRGEFPGTDSEPGEREKRSLTLRSNGAWTAYESGMKYRLYGKV